MIPKWKIARELDRAGQQLRALAGLVWEPFAQRAYDRKRSQTLNVEEGAVPLGQQIALFLLYQPKGILASTFLVCSHVVEKGYAPLVVSNAPLSRKDRDRLNQLCWKTVVRPNYGYDFGGYRDGILLLADLGVTPERLIILNDSVWFPIGPGETLIDRMEALDADLVGAVVHPAMRRRRLSTKRRAFLESYFYLLNRQALKHPSFARFWRKFRVSSNKYNAVYRGERGFSHAMEDAGLRVDGVLDPGKLVDALEAADDATLRKTMAEFAPDVLLCDIEGGELELIPALDATNLKAVMIELHPDRLSAEQLNRGRAALSAQRLLQSSPGPGGTVEVFTRRIAT